MDKPSKSEPKGRMERLLQIWITDEMFENYLRVAKSDDRTVSGWARYILNKATGKPPKTPK